MELSAVDPWGTPAAPVVSSAGPSPLPTVSASAASGPWGTATTDPWGVASPTSPTSSDPWGGGAPPVIAPPPDPWGESSNKVNNVDPWGSSGKDLRPVVMFDLCRQSGGWDCTCCWWLKQNLVSVGERGCGDFFSPSLHGCISPHTCHHAVIADLFIRLYMLSLCSDESKHAIPPLCLNQGFLSSCFYSGLTVAVSTRAFSSLALCMPFSVIYLLFIYLFF